MPAPNKQLERTVMRRHVRAACAAFHCAHAARWTRGHAAAQLRRWADNENDKHYEPRIEWDERRLDDVWMGRNCRFDDQGSIPCPSSNWVDVSDEQRRGPRFR